MKASERRLIAILAVLAAICGGAIMAQKLLNRQHSLDRQQQTLDLQQMEATAMLAESDLWKARLDWLKANQPSMTSETVATEKLLDEMLDSAAKNKLTVQKRQLHESNKQPFYSEVGVTLTVMGDLPDVFRWLHSLLSPESFRLVSQLKIAPDAKDNSKVDVTVRINRRHAPVITSTAVTKEGAGS